ncbi:HAD-IA family hydrolase [Halocynthiibacter sp. C4]|uniref:HAD-IA family hydrolase n=1 Tax=Halocynthiibacter sp. C4 TaxID=2992758 RepID=UPI00237BCC1E|nr:HAD-IA family hydrolase [Halocynthiibacter sp. C4]MDE0589244.1 HAD-IA family hydrolase [Halocynthiibacter sp. C4]
MVFDLDGTLADTSADLIAAANYCFQGLGHGDVLDPVADALTAFHGGRAMLALGYARVDPEGAEAGVPEQYPVLLEAYGREIDRHTRLYDGAMDAVEALRGRGFAVSICTNKPEGLAESLLSRLGVRDAFDALIGADTLPTRKPDVAPYHAAVTQAGGEVERSILIGDTVTDRDTARAAGVPIVLVGFGPTGEAVSALEPDALLAHYRDLPDLAEALLP